MKRRAEEQQSLIEGARPAVLLRYLSRSRANKAPLTYTDGDGRTPSDPSNGQGFILLLWLPSTGLESQTTNNQDAATLHATRLHSR